MYNNTFDTTVASVEAENVGMFSAHEVSGSSAREMRKLLHSRLSLFVNRSLKSFFYSSARSFGMFFLALGIMTLLMNLLEYYFLAEPNVPLSSLVMRSFGWNRHSLGLVTLVSFSRGLTNITVTEKTSSVIALRSAVSLTG